MNNPITTAILGAIGAPAPANTVTVTWANGSRATYSASMLDLLRTDPAAIDIQDDETGELVYINPATRTPAEAAQEAPAAEAEQQSTETAEEPETITAMWQAIHEADAELQRVQDPEHIQAQADAMTWHIPDTDWTAVITAALQGVEL